MSKSDENPLSPECIGEIEEVLKLLNEDKDLDVDPEEKDDDNSISESDSLNIIERKQDIKAKKKYAKEFISLAKCWLVFIGTVIVLNSLSYDSTIFDWISLSFSISDTVILALLGTSLVNVLTPAFLVANYLFNTSRNNSP